VIRVLTWNVHGRIRTSGVGDPDILAALAKSEASVVALQELAFDATGRHGNMASLGARLGVPHLAIHDFSPSHLATGERIGVALLSRWELDAQRAITLPNPRISVVRDGRELVSHDKGALVANAKVGNRWIVIVSIHLLPSHLFGHAPGDSSFYPIWRALSDILRDLADCPTILCGDFNVDSLAAVVPDIFEEGLFQCAIDLPTRPNGRRHDKILCSHHWTVVRGEVLEAEADHYACIADLRLRERNRRDWS
jgi:endonuclease/exonuclease/phosphatase family metal-dependent hydrolase